MIAALSAALLAAAPAAERAGWRWTAGDTALEATFGVAMLADWRQTLAIGRGLRFEGYSLEESNPVLGTHPSASRVNAYFVATGAFHAGVALALPGRWRTWWQMVGIGIEAHAITRNALNGITLRMMF